jgi:hypothetical protein
LFGVAVPGGKKKGIGAPRLRLAPTWTPHWSGQTAFWDPVLASGLLRVCIGFWKIGGGSGHGYLGGVVCSLSLRGTRGGVYIYFRVFFLAYSRWIEIFHIEYIRTFTHAKVPYSRIYLRLRIYTNSITMPTLRNLTTRLKTAISPSSSPTTSPTSATSSPTSGFEVLSGRREGDAFTVKRPETNARVDSFTTDETSQAKQKRVSRFREELDVFSNE